MGWKRNTLTWLYDHGLLWFEPIHFLKTYVYPSMVRGTRRRYQAQRFADSYYRAAATDGFSDRITIAPDVDPRHAEFHYNATENSIIRALVRYPVRPGPAVLDIGSGGGHWINFWRATFQASTVCGLELSTSCSDALTRKYSGQPEVRIVRGSIADDGLELGQRFDVINAIGVIFHIVDDELWRRALVNMQKLLADDGVIVVGGYFGWLTRDTQFHLTDDFDDFGTSMDPRQLFAAREVYVNKRVRSLPYWRKAALAAGLQVQAVIRTAWCPEIATPENNVLVLKKRAVERQD